MNQTVSHPLREVEKLTGALIRAAWRFAADWKKHRGLRNAAHAIASAIHRWTDQAALAFDSGIWFAVKTGVRGLVVADENGVRRVYPILEPASAYYGVMTKSEWMPCLVGQVIDGVPDRRVIDGREAICSTGPVATDSSGE